MAENPPNLKKETDIQVQEVQRVPNNMNRNRPTSRQIIKMAKVKDKERTLKAAKEKAKSHIQQDPHKADFSAETLQARGRGTIHSKC